jgi:predicted methyltransferase
MKRIGRSGKFSANEFLRVIQEIIRSYNDYTDSSKECLITTTKTFAYLVKTKQESKPVIEIYIGINS